MSVPYWYRENLYFKQQNRQIAERGLKLLEEALALNEEVSAFIKLIQVETRISDLGELSKLPKAKPYLEKCEQAQILHWRGEACLGRWAECERVRLDNLRCAMQFHGVDLIPSEWQPSEVAA